MGIGEPKMPTPEEMAETQKQRALSNAELIKDGAEYRYDKKGNSTLGVTEEQKSTAKKEMSQDKLLGEAEKIFSETWSEDDLSDLADRLFIGVSLFEMNDMVRFANERVDTLLDWSIEESLEMKSFTEINGKEQAIKSIRKMFTHYLGKSYAKYLYSEMQK